jgi:hypothetical protein
VAKNKEEVEITEEKGRIVIVKEIKNLLIILLIISINHLIIMTAMEEKMIHIAEMIIAKEEINMMTIK